MNVTEKNEVCYGKSRKTLWGKGENTDTVNFNLPSANVFNLD